MPVKDYLVFKECTQDDLPFVFNSWIQSNWTEYRGKMPRSTYKNYQRILIGDILTRSLCIIARNKADLSQICGYTVFEADVLHYVYVKSPFRRTGIGTELLNRAFEKGLHPVFECSHNGSLVENFLHEPTINIFRCFYASQVC